jgi:hypothetical protein
VLGAKPVAGAGGELGQVGGQDADFARVGHDDPGEQAEQGRFAGARRADQQQLFAPRNGEAVDGQRKPAPAGPCEADAGQGDDVFPTGVVDVGGCLALRIQGALSSLIAGASRSTS